MDRPSTGETGRRGPGRPAGARAGEGRRELLRSARALMAERGFPRVTVREVARRAGVRPAMVNYYFGGKRGLLRAVVAEVAGEAGERMRSTAAEKDSVEDRLRRMIADWVGALGADPYAARLAVEQVLFAEEEVIDTFVERFARPNLDAIRSLLDEGRDRGEFREVDLAFLLPAISGICLFFFLGAPVARRLFGAGEITPDRARDFADSAAALVLRGIAAPAGEPG